MKYKVFVTRTSYSAREIEIEANSEKEAREKALDEAGDYEFSEGNAEYEIEYIDNALNWNDNGTNTSTATSGTEKGTVVSGEGGSGD